jgi:hypothetical protein
MISKRTAIVGAVGLALAGATAASAALPSFDAKTQSAAATQQMNMWCQQQGSCMFSSPPTVSNVLGPFRALSDKLINCNQPPGEKVDLGKNALESEGETAQSDTRGQGTTLEEALDAEVKLGILKTELDVSTKQYDAISTGSEIRQSVPVSPGYEGYVATRWPTVLADGTITDGIHFQVTSFELSYPGFGITGGNLGQIDVVPVSEPLTDSTAKPPRDDYTKYCTGLPPIVVQGQLAQATAGPVVTVCVAGHRRCGTRPLVLANASRLISGNATVAFVRGRRVYATGPDRHGRITVHAARPVRSGSYTMLINGRNRETMVSAKLLH